MLLVGARRLWRTKKILSMVVCATPDTQMTVAEALAALALTWTTGGDQEWRAEPCGYPFGGHSVNSGPVPFGAESWLETTITGPGLLSFQWMGGDLAQVSVGEKLVISTSHPPAYWEEAQIQIPAGPQIVRWRMVNQWSTSPPYPKMHLAIFSSNPTPLGPGSSGMDWMARLRVLITIQGARAFPTSYATLSAFIRMRMDAAASRWVPSNGTFTMIRRLTSWHWSLSVPPHSKI